MTTNLLLSLNISMGGNRSEPFLPRRTKSSSPWRSHEQNKLDKRPPLGPSRNRCVCDFTRLLEFSFMGNDHACNANTSYPIWGYKILPIVGSAPAEICLSTYFAVLDFHFELCKSPKCVDLRDKLYLE